MPERGGVGSAQLSIAGRLDRLSSTRFQTANGFAADLMASYTHYHAPWRAYWYIRAVPAGIDVSVGSKALVDWVRSQLP